MTAGCPRFQGCYWRLQIRIPIVLAWIYDNQYIDIWGLNIEVLGRPEESGIFALGILGSVDREYGDEDGITFGDPTKPLFRTHVF